MDVGFEELQERLATDIERVAWENGYPFTKAGPQGDKLVAMSVADMSDPAIIRIIAFIFARMETVEGELHVYLTFGGSPGLAENSPKNPLKFPMEDLKTKSLSVSLGIAEEMNRCSLSILSDLKGQE